MLLSPVPANSGLTAAVTSLHEYLISASKVCICLDNSRAVTSAVTKPADAGDVAGKPAAGSASEVGAGRDGQTSATDDSLLAADDSMLSEALSQYYADAQQDSGAAKVNSPTLVDSQLPARQTDLPRPRKLSPPLFLKVAQFQKSKILLL